jgi:vacuolar-type H+-ATPase subunit H
MSYQDRPTSSEPAWDDPQRTGQPEQEEGQPPASAGDHAREAASAGRDQAREVASTTTEQARRVASTTQDEARQVVRGANEQARRLVGDTRDELRSQANAQVDRLAQGLNDVSRQLRSMGENGEPGAVTDMACEAAVRTQQISERLRGGGIDDVLSQLRNAGRNRPGLFLLGAFGTGLVAGRVVRNLAREPGGNGSSDPSTTGGGGAPSRSIETGYQGSTATGAIPPTSPPDPQTIEATTAAPATNAMRGQR